MGGIRLAERQQLADGGVVDQQVEPVEALGDRGERRRHLPRVGDVAAQRQRRTAQPVGDRAQRIEVAAEHRDRGTLARQRLADAAAEAARRAGDRRDLAFKTPHTGSQGMTAIEGRLG